LFAIVALFIAVIAWAQQAMGDGLTNPWAWLFAALAFFIAEFVFGPIVYARTGGPWRRG
jgi:hypothetical protein